MTEKTYDFEQVRDMGSLKYGDLYGDVENELHSICPLTETEYDHAFATPGVKWAYFVAVIKSRRKSHSTNLTQSKKLSPTQRELLAWMYKCTITDRQQVAQRMGLSSMWDVSTSMDRAKMLKAIEHFKDIDADRQAMYDTWHLHKGIGY